MSTSDVTRLPTVNDENNCDKSLLLHSPHSSSESGNSPESSSNRSASHQLPRSSDFSISRLLHQSASPVQSTSSASAASSSKISATADGLQMSPPTNNANLIATPIALDWYSQMNAAALFQQQMLRLVQQQRMQVRKGSSRSKFAFSRPPPSTIRRCCRSAGRVCIRCPSTTSI